MAEKMIGAGLKDISKPASRTFGTEKLVVNRLSVPESGVVRYRGDDVARLDPLVLRRRIGMVFQRPTAFPGTVRDNLAEAAPDRDGRYEIAMKHAAHG